MAHHVFKYQNLVSSISRRIRCGEFSPGTRLPGQVALARQYGVSTITANRALDELRKLGLVERRERSGSFVKAAYPRLCEVIAIAKTPLRERRARAMDFWHGLCARGEADNVPVQLVSVTDPALARRLQHPGGEGGRGAVLLDFDDEAVLEMLGRRRVPHVVVGLESRTCPFCVLEDRRRAAAELTRALAAQGCRRLAFAGNLSARNHRLAAEGFRLAMEELGLGAARVVEVDDATVAPGVAGLLAERPAVDGLLIMGGGLPFLALPVLLKRARVPRLGFFAETAGVMRLRDAAWIAHYSQEEAGAMAFDLLREAAAGSLVQPATRYPSFTIVPPAGAGATTSMTREAVHR